MNGEVGINGETGKNTSIRNFIELKSSNNLVIYQQKEHKKYQGSFSIWRITSKPDPVYAYKHHAY